eukprot:5207526-Alexandrium_andersonii.AAC.1
MHVLPLGVCQWAAACSMLTLCDEGVFGRRAIADKSIRLNSQLKAAWRDFKRWLHRSRIDCSQPRFNLARMGR